MAKRAKVEKAQVKLSKVSNTVKVWETVYEREMALHGNEDTAQSRANLAAMSFSTEELERPRHERPSVTTTMAAALSEVGL